MKKMMKKIINVIFGALLLTLISCGGIGGGLGGNSDSDEKAYIGFSADVARFVVASQKLEELLLSREDIQYIQKYAGSGMSRKY